MILNAGMVQTGNIGLVAKDKQARLLIYIPDKEAKDLLQHFASTDKREDTHAVGERMTW
jgi:hypothetical protein